MATAERGALIRSYRRVDGSVDPLRDLTGWIVASN